MSSSPNDNTLNVLMESSIVFVHGLRGHRRNTWTKDNVCWPEQLLSKEEALAHVRILAFGYDANVINAMGRASLNSLFDHSINLLNELFRVRRQDAVSLVRFWGVSTQIQSV